MIEKCQLAASEISELDIINTTTVSDTITRMGSLRVTRLIVTDQAGKAIYDSLTMNSTVGKYVLLPEIVQALRVNDVFRWEYSNGTMKSFVATPILNYGTLSGCVYMMEYDISQGVLMYSLLRNILTITLVLEIVVIIFSALFAIAFSKRMRRILASMRIIREGDYSHKVKMGGSDELTVLGDEFNDLTDRLMDSENKRRQFVSDASHELKTPLASIKLLSDSILQNDMDIPTIKEFVGDIGDEADRLNRMTQKMLDLTRGEDDQNDIREIIYMAPTVERVVRMLSTQAENSGIQIELDLTNDAPILIREDDLYRITFNLVENGIKYNRSNGTLTISLSRNEEFGILTVADTGTGIPEDSLPHIFERFYRVDKARSRASGGSGLGLSIVRNMVLRNQGQIHVESTFGLGATFTVEFPAFDTEEEEV
jgi:signal transduction histidine kinase